MWDASALGREAYANHNGNILDAANEWADRGVTFWTSFFSNAVADGEKLLKENGIEVVDYDVAGFFHDPDRPGVVIASVLINPKVGPPRQPQKNVVTLLPRTEPYSSNPVTRELIAGHSERAIATLAPWNTKRTTINEPDRNWRALEYLIQETAKYDHSVNSTVNVLEITANQKPHWIQNLTCR